MRIIKQASYGISESYSLDFGNKENDGEIHLCSGFDCDKDGNVFPLEYEAAKENLKECLAGQRPDGTKLYPMGINKRSHSWREDAIGECVSCKRHVTLSGFTNTCECGADYNQSGQLLADRSQWGEETGETASDILNCDYSKEFED